MRRYALPLALAVAAAALVTPATASPARRTPNRASVTDPAGDWPVASEDILGVRVETVRVDGKPALRAVITLAAEPDPLTEYFVSVAGRCHTWTIFNRTPYAASADARLMYSECVAPSRPATLPASAPATVVVSGKDVVLTAPYALGLATGMRIMSVTAVASVRGAAVSAPVVGFRWTGDYASADVVYALG